MLLTVVWCVVQCVGWVVLCSCVDLCVAGIVCCVVG